MCWLQTLNSAIVRLQRPTRCRNMSIYRKNFSFESHVNITVSGKTNHMVHLKKNHQSANYFEHLIHSNWCSLNEILEYFTDPREPISRMLSYIGRENVTTTTKDNVTDIGIPSSGSSGDAEVIWINLMLTVLLIVLPRKHYLH